MSSGEMSESDMYGCHDEFNTSTEVNELKHKVERLEQYVQHLNWHLFVYRSALLQVPGGHDELHNKLKEFDGAPLCTSCEKDELLARIHSLETQISTSPILCTGKKRRVSRNQ